MQDHVLWRLFGATALIYLLFAFWPQIDIYTSGLFLQADGSFWLVKSAMAEDLRLTIWYGSVALALGAMVMLIVSLLRGANAQTSWRLWAFVTVLYVTGPGLLVNVILKQHWGRARPASVVEFGGDRLFTPPFEIADQCASNCSFVSGEAASSAAMAIVLAILFARHVAKPKRIAFIGLLAAIFVLASGMRVASGRHFLSDVVFAGLFMLIVARLTYRGFAVPAVVPHSMPRAIAADLAGLFKLSSGMTGAKALENVVIADHGDAPKPDTDPS